MDDGHTLAWSVDGARFELQVTGDAARLCLPDGELIDLSNREWAGLARAIGMIVASAAPPAKTLPKRSQPVEKGGNAGVRWTSEHDAELVKRWHAGATIEDLMAHFERNAGGIASRLVRLDVAADREDIRLEDEKRRKARKAR